MTTNLSHMQNITITGNDLQRSYEAGAAARNQGLRRDPPATANASSDMALAWTCGWDAAEAVRAAAGQPWQDDADPRTTVG